VAAPANEQGGAPSPLGILDKTGVDDAGHHDEWGV